MARITWDKAGERFYETGVDHGVLYPKNAPGVPWNGLTSVEQAVAGGESEAYYFDGIKYYSNIANQDFQATLSAFTYPREFEACEGSIEMAQGLVFSNQSVRYFGLAWRTKIGTDQDGDFAYRLHIVYNLTAEPTTKTHETVSDSPSPSNFQWTLDALPDVPGSSLLTSNNSPDTWVWPAGVGMSGWPNGPDGNTPVKGWKATPYIWVDSDKVTKTNWDSLNDHLYGTLHSPAYLPSQVDIMNMMNGLDVPKTPAFAWTDPNPDDGGDDGDGDGDDDGGGSTLGDLGALLVTATPAPDWTGVGQFPPYNLEYPSLNNSGEYPEDAAIVAAALSDSSDASFITIAHSIGVQANSYYYPMMLSQQTEFEREWPSMPGPGAPRRGLETLSMSTRFIRPFTPVDIPAGFRSIFQMILSSTVLSRTTSSLSIPMTLLELGLERSILDTSGFP
jgi:hypothetical protein